MKRPLRSVSIGTKLTGIQLVTTGVVLLICGAVILVNSRHVLRDDHVETLSSTARVIGFNSLAPLEFLDPDAARDVLASLQTQPDIHEAALYDSDGAVFASYRRDPTQPYTFGAVGAEPVRFVRDHVEVLHPIERRGQRVGTVFLRADLSHLDARSWHYVGIMAALIALGLLVAVVISRFLQRTVTRRIVGLARTMHRVSVQEDYGLRVSVRGDDELEWLSREFNHMLDIIEARNRALRDAQDVLELRVDERTAELEAEMAERLKAVAAAQESERRFGAIVGGLLEGLIVVDDEGHIQLVNPAAEAIFGFTAEELTDRPIQSLLASRFDRPDDQSPTRLDEGLGEVSEWQGRRSDGTIFPAELLVSEVVLDGRRHHTANIRDVSERRRLDLLKDEFVSTVSHELRTPVTSIYGALSLVLGDVAGPVSTKARELVEISHRNSERLIRLLNDLLDIQRIEAGMLELKYERIDVNGVVAHAVDASLGYAAPYEVEIDTDLAPNGCWVMGDADHLSQVLINLLSNAVKYSPRGGRVEVASAIDGDQARVSVRDHGVGIPPEHHGRIFGKFQQVDGSVTRERGGTGLGLAIARALIERHDGDIDFESAVGEGSTFWFVLPLAPVDGEAPREEI